MNRLRLIVSAVLLSVVLASAAREARADTFVLTSGSIPTAGDQAQIHDATGDGFTLHATTVGPYQQSSCPPGQPCQSGQVVTAGGTLSISFQGMPATATVNGVDYTNLALHGSTLNFVTGPLTLRGGFEPNLFAYTVQVPFTMTGTVVGSVFVDPLTAGTTLFTVDVTGQGVASVQIIHVITSVGYTFQPQPTPEPATMILFGTSLAGLTAYARRRRSGK